MKTPKILTHLWFEKDADKAAAFYCSIFPDSRVDRVTPLAADSPSGPAGSVVMVEFTLLGAPFMAITAGKHDPFNDAASILVNCDTQAEIDKYWNAIQEGGKAVACGWVIDRYGVRWQITASVLRDLLTSADEKVRQRVAAAQMKMKKIDIAALQAAAKG
ncbi:MAG TPA: VOC family protein [Kofleriaceae bacterium]|jgi:predicted 3-demethylubiquinone-9 3-methyltransferase (glyoxalase superfamily)